MMLKQTPSRRRARRDGLGLAVALGIASFAVRWAFALPAAPRDDRGMELLRVQADADASVDSARPDVALGAMRVLTVGHGVGSGASTTQAFLRFPLTSLPKAATIISATLVLDRVALQGKAEVLLHISSVRDAWRESDLTWRNRPTGLDPRVFVLSGPALRPMAHDMSVAVIEHWQAGRTEVDMAISASEDAIDRGRSRTFASREALPGGGVPPRLDIAYVGAGTPHPFPTRTPTPVPSVTPSLTPSVTPTRNMTTSPTPTATATPSPTATTTSTFLRPQGQAALLRPSEGASLAQPIGGEVWAFAWRAPNLGPCGYSGARLTLVPPLGESIVLDVEPLYHLYAADRPVAGGRWRWTVLARCSHGPTWPSEEGSFLVDAAEVTPGATPSATATGRPSPGAGRRELWLPWLSRSGFGIFDRFPR
jgi:hypothetical protein